MADGSSDPAVDPNTDPNTKALNINNFINSSKTNKGYYIARYEASKKNDDMPFSKSGAVWNYITQPEAARVSVNMYKNNKSVTSDLVNSYAWDTAIYFIQEFSSNGTYSMQTSKNTTLGNTGEREGTTDKVCNIYDMASNTKEWSTETSSATSLYCVSRRRKLRQKLLSSI